MSWKRVLLAVIIITIGSVLFSIITVYNTYWRESKSKFFLQLILTIIAVLSVGASLFYGYYFIWFS